MRRDLKINAFQVCAWGPCNGTYLIWNMIFVKNHRTCIAGKNNWWWQWEASSGSALIFRLKLHYSHVLCIIDCAWMNLNSWGMWLEVQEVIQEIFSVLKWKAILSWAVFFQLFFINKKGDSSYQWRMSVKHHLWTREIRPSLLKHVHFLRLATLMFLSERGSLLSVLIKICLLQRSLLYF